MYGLLRATIGPTVRLVWRVRVRGAERLPSGPVVVAANHDSLADPFFLGSALPRPLRFLAKEELWSLGLVGRLLDAAGCIPVSRGRGDAAAMSAAVAALEAGDAVALFPQGTTRPYRDRPWHRGAARLALATGAPLLPVCLVHTEKALRPYRVRIGFPSVRVLVGEPIAVEPSPATIASARALTDRLRAVIEAMHAPYGPPAHAWIDLEDTAAREDCASPGTRVR